MTTKEQERKALEKIKAIIAELDSDGYVATAFEGCIEDAETNIEYDWACSMKERAETAERELDLEREKIAKLQNEIDGLKTINHNLNTELNKAHDDCKNYYDCCMENWNNFREQEDRAEALELEVIKLKAKLYDYMTK